MKKDLERNDIPPVDEFIRMISDAGAGIYACKASVDMFKLRMEDFCPQVDGILTVGDFYQRSAQSRIIFT